MATPSRASFARLEVKAADELVEWNGQQEDGPREGTFYPVDPATLPPGVDPESLVTLAHIVDGEAVGGVTYALDTNDPDDDPKLMPVDP